MNPYHENGLPTVSEMHQLPLWAMVAFSTQCARLVQPLFRISWPDAPIEYDTIIEDSICIGEMRPAVEINWYLQQTGNIYNDVNKIRRDHPKETHVAQNAVGSTNYLVYTIKCALVNSRAYAAENAVDAGKCAYEANHALLLEIRQIFNELLAASIENNWDDQDQQPLFYFSKKKSSWKELNVFISSTFRDMHAERDYLCRVVFPVLRQRLEPYRIFLTEIDLRWGITREQVENEQVLETCLDQIDKCKPFFVGLLGDRYGYVVDHIPKEVANKFPWLADYPERSITEYEFLQGALLQGDPALFLLRNQTFHQDLPLHSKQEFLETNPVALEKLKQLKQQIIHSGQDVFEYSDLRGFGEKITSYLWNLIQKTYHLPDTPPLKGQNSKADQSGLHERFRRQRLRNYAQRPEIDAQLLQYALASDKRKPLALLGQAGMGKSACLAHLADHLSTSFPEIWLIEHYLGASPESEWPVFILTRFCSVLQQWLGIRDELPLEVPKLEFQLNRLLHLVPEDQSLVFILDGLEKLDSTAQPELGFRFPILHPDHVRVVMSSQRPLSEDRYECLTLAPLQKAEQAAIIHQSSLLTAKMLDSAQIDLLCANAATREPLYLQVALEELRGFGSFELLEDRIRRFPSGENTSEVLFSQVLERWESEIGADTVRAVLGLLYCSRYGLAEHELIALYRQYLPENDASSLFVLLRQLLPYLQYGDTLLSLHPQALKASIKRRYFPEAQKTQPFQLLLSKYFDVIQAIEGETDNLTRALSEATFHCSKAGRWPVVTEMLSNPRFLELKLEKLGLERLLNDFDLVRESDFIGHENAKHGLILIGEALRISAHIIRTEPKQLFAQLGGRLLGLSSDYPVIEQLLNSIEQQDNKWQLLPISPCFKSPGTELSHTSRGHDDGINTLAISADGRFFVTGARGHLPKLWDTESGLEIDMFQSQDFHKNEVEVVLHDDADGLSRNLRSLSEYSFQFDTTAIVISPDMRWIVTGNQKGYLYIWDVFCVRPTSFLMQATSGRTMCIKFTPDGKKIISVGAQGMFQVWDFEERTRIKSSSLECGFVNDLVFSDASTAIVACEDGLIRFWNWELKKTIGELRGHQSGVWGLAITPDKKRLLSASNDQTVKVWDLQSGKNISTFIGHQNVVRTVKVFRNGTLAASGDRDNKILIWEIDTHKIIQTLEGHASWIHALEITPDERFILSASEDGTVKIWDLNAGAGQAGESPSADWIYGLATSEDGQIAVTGGRDKMLKIWDLNKNTALKSIAAHADRINAVALSPDGKHAYSGSGGLFFPDYYFKKWEVETGKTLFSKREHNGDLLGICVNQDASIAATVAEDACLKIWDTQSGKVLKTMEHSTRYLRAVAISKDGKIGVTGCQEGKLYGWDLKTGDSIFELKGHTDSIRSIDLSADGSIMVSGARDNKVLLWDLHTGQQLQSFEGHIFPVQAVALTPNGKMVLTASNDHYAKVWEIETGECLGSFRAEGSLNACLALDNHRFLFSGESGIIYQLELTGFGRVSKSENNPKNKDTTALLERLNQPKSKEIQLIARTPTPEANMHTQMVKSIAVSGDYGHTTLVYTASYDGQIKVWDPHSAQWVRSIKAGGAATAIVDITRSGVFAVAVEESPGNFPIHLVSIDPFAELPSEVARILMSFEAHAAKTWMIAASRHSSFIFSASSDRTVTVWKPSGEDFNIKFRWMHPDFVNVVALSSDAQFACSGGGGNDLYVWKTEHGDLIWRLSGHKAAITAITMLPSDKYVLTGGWDNSIIVWDLETGEIAEKLDMHDDPVTGLAVTPNGCYVLSVSHDGTARLWDTQTWECKCVYEDDMSLQCCTAIDNQQFVIGTTEGPIRFLNIE